MIDRSTPIPAQLMIGTSPGVPVAVLALDETGCLIDGLPDWAAGAMAQPGDYQLWLGAIGPLRLRYAPEASGKLAFDGDINPLIVAHFNA